MRLPLPFQLGLGALLACALVLLMVTPLQAETSHFTLTSIGQVSKTGHKTEILIDATYQAGLLRLEDFSHVWVLWWYDQNDTPERRAILQVHPRRDPRNPLSGVFATRAPVRPNLIGMTLCRILAVHDAGIEVDAIDAYDGTPVIDLKPYLPTEAVPNARGPERY